MDYFVYLGIATYIISVNIIAFIAYKKEANSPSPRLPALFLLVPPIVGGSVGACLANYIFKTEHRELRSWLSKPIGYIPPISLLVQIPAVIAITKNGGEMLVILDYLFATFGLLGYFFLAMNVLSFVLIAIRKSAYYFAPSGKKLIPDVVLIPIVLLGGAPGATLSKIMFNFYEDWRFDSTKQIQNFLYNKGMFLVCAIQIGIFVYIL